MAILALRQLERVGLASRESPTQARLLDPAQLIRDWAAWYAMKPVKYYRFSDSSETTAGRDSQTASQEARPASRPMGADLHGGRVPRRSVRDLQRGPHSFTQGRAPQEILGGRSAPGRPDKLGPIPPDQPLLRRLRLLRSAESSTSCPSSRHSSSTSVATVIRSAGVSRPSTSSPSLDAEVAPSRLDYEYPTTRFR